MVNLSKDIWPRSMWRTIHSCAAGADTSTKKHYFKIWIQALGHLIPCEECREHFAKVVEKYGIDNYMDPNVSLLKFTWLVHNDVNHRLGKQKIHWDVVQTFYLGQESSCDTSCQLPIQRKWK